MRVRDVQRRFPLHPYNFLPVIDLLAKVNPAATMLRRCKQEPFDIAAAIAAKEDAMMARAPQDLEACFGDGT